MIGCDSQPAEDWQTEADKMINSAVVRALRRRISFYLNSPVFNKYGRSLKDFLIVTFLTILTMFVLLVLFFTMLWFSDDDSMTGYGSCGTPECIDQ